MKKAGLLLFSLFHLLAYGQSTKKVLFLGNSYTYVNNLPQLVANLAGTTGNAMTFDMYAPGGYTLAQHLNDSASIDKIKAGNWDYVVLQEQSQLPSFEDYNNIPGYYLANLIRIYNPCARVLFYMTWGRKNGDAANCPLWPPVCTYEGMDSLIRQRYEEMAQLCNASLSPVGAVWRYTRKNNPAIELYDADGSHPSVAGTYLAACSFYTAIFKKDPTLAVYNPGGLNPTYAATIRMAAKKVVFDSLPKWDYENHTPTAKFRYVIQNGNNEVFFSNQSENADSYVWDFGDGQSSSLPHPTHQYAADGTYTVKLTATNCDLTSTYTSTQQVTISFCAHNPTVFPDNVLLCPNAKDTLWTQAYDAFQWLDEKGDTIPGETKQYFVPGKAGYFSVIAQKDNCPEQSPQVFVNIYVHLGTYNVFASGPFIATDTLCMDDTLELAVVPNKPPFPNDSDVQWYRNGALFMAGNDTILVTQPGEYSVKITDPVCPNYIAYQSPAQQYTFINCDSTIIMDIAQLPVQQAIRLYPNPAGEVLQVNIPASIIGSYYKITDILGKTILTGRMEQESNNLQLHSLASGVYVFQIQNKALKFIKE